MAKLSIGWESFIWMLKTRMTLLYVCVGRRRLCNVLQVVKLTLIFTHDCKSENHVIYRNRCQDFYLTLIKSASDIRLHYYCISVLFDILEPNDRRLAMQQHQYIILLKFLALSNIKACLCHEFADQFFQVSPYILYLIIRW